MFTQNYVFFPSRFVCVCVRVRVCFVCVCVCARVCVRACACACVRVRACVRVCVFFFRIILTIHSHCLPIQLSELRVGRCIALLFHDRSTRRRRVFSSTPRPHFTPRKRPGNNWTGGWVSSRADLDGRKISSPLGIDPGPSSP